MLNKKYKNYAVNSLKKPLLSKVEMMTAYLKLHPMKQMARRLDLMSLRQVQIQRQRRFNIVITNL